jgi:hypothetical protein
VTGIKIAGKKVSFEYKVGKKWKKIKSSKLKKVKKSSTRAKASCSWRAPREHKTIHLRAHVAATHYNAAGTSAEKKVTIV